MKVYHGRTDIERFEPFSWVPNLASGPLARDFPLGLDPFSPHQKAPVLRTGAIPPKLLALGGI